MPENQGASPLPRPPDLELGALRIWVEGREFPESQDYWDGNWLIISAQCRSPHSEASIRGAIVHLSDLQEWLAQLTRLAVARDGEAILGCMEADLCAQVHLAEGGVGELVAEIRHDDTERHEWRFEVHAADLPRWIAALEDLRRRFPTRGTP